MSAGNAACIMLHFTFRLSPFTSKKQLPNKKRIFAKNIRPLYGFDRRILFRSPTA